MSVKENMIMTNLLCQGSERSLSLRDDQMIVIQIVNNLKNTCTAEYNFVLAISSCCGLNALLECLSPGKFFLTFNRERHF